MTSWSATSYWPTRSTAASSAASSTASNSDRRCGTSDFHDAVIVECPDQTLIGKSFGTIADERGLHPLDAFLDVLVENGERNVRWTTIVANHRPKQLNKLAAEPSIHLGFSDAGAHLRNMAFYNFSLRLLKRTLDAYRDGKPFLTIERAVYRLTGEVAEWFGLDAGTLAGRRSRGLRRDRSRRPGRLGGCLPRGKGSVLRRPEPDGQPQRRGGGGNGCGRRNRVPRRPIPRRLRKDREVGSLPAGGRGSSQLAGSSA